MKTVDKYLAIIAIGIIYTFFSFLYEFHAEPEKKRIQGTLVPSFLVRALHGIVSAYLSVYIFFFYKRFIRSFFFPDWAQLSIQLYNFYFFFKVR